MQVRSAFVAATSTDLSAPWAEWVSAQLDRTGWSKRELARRAAVNDVTVGRWVKGQNVPTEAEVVRRVADAVGENPVVALIAAGMITAEEVNATFTTEVMRLEEVADWALVEEIRRRFEAYAQGAKGPGDAPNRPRTTGQVYATNESIAHLRPGEQLAARRGNRSKR